MKEFKKGEAVTRGQCGNASRFNKGALDIMGTSASKYNDKTIFEIEGTVKLITFNHDKEIYGAYLLKKDGVNVGYVYNTYLYKDNSKIEAAATGLLKALQDVLDSLGGEYGINDDVYQKSIEAINKALN